MGDASREKELRALLAYVLLAQGLWARFYTQFKGDWFLANGIVVPRGSSHFRIDYGEHSRRRYFVHYENVQRFEVISELSALPGILNEVLPDDLKALGLDRV